MSTRNSTAFNRMFNAELLSVRKDITPCMLAAAMGKTDEVARLVKANPFEFGMKNKDGNGLLLLAVANCHVKVTNFLLDMKSDIMHRNGMQMDAMDYATIDGVRTPVAKVILNHCDFVVPELPMGVSSQYTARSLLTMDELQKTGFNFVRSNIIGKTPDFSDIFGDETEYRVEWTKSLMLLCNLVRRGMLLLSDEIAYLERDALLSGSLEVPINRRFVYLPETQTCIKYAVALKKVYALEIELRMVEACREGDATAVQGLLKAKAHPNIEDVRGQSVLMYASQKGEPLVVKCLLQAKALVNQCNKDGFGSVLLAAVGNKEMAVRLLLRAKADVRMATNKSHTVMDFVKHEGHSHMMKVIREELRELRVGAGTEEVFRPNPQH